MITTLCEDNSRECELITIISGYRGDICLNIDGGAYYLCTKGFFEYMEADSDILIDGLTQMQVYYE
ncbi:hypothetical protein [Flavobacterium sp.]|uniref:hypothetical protein n=1 Tax=Flavobacterium sp. TaxID=239 RepID=UPI003A93A3FE